MATYNNLNLVCSVTEIYSIASTKRKEISDAWRTCEDIRSCIHFHLFSFPSNHNLVRGMVMLLKGRLKEELSVFGHFHRDSASVREFIASPMTIRIFNTHYVLYVSKAFVENFRTAFYRFRDVKIG